jgi:hypothetical protein
MEEVGSQARQEPYVEPFPSAAILSAAKEQGAHEFPFGAGLGNSEVARMTRYQQLQ